MNCFDYGRITANVIVLPKITAAMERPTFPNTFNPNNANCLLSKRLIDSFPFDQKNNIVTVGSRDEYFACAYDIDPVTNVMISYSCVEGNIKNSDGKNTINLGSGSENTLSTGSFKPVKGSDIDKPTIRVVIPLSDRKDVKEIKVVTMIKGEFESRTIDAHKLLKQSNHNTIIVPLNYDKSPEIGPIQEGDLFLLVFPQMS